MVFLYAKTFHFLSLIYVHILKYFYIITIWIQICLIMLSNLKKKIMLNICRFFLFIKLLKSLINIRLSESVNKLSRKQVFMYQCFMIILIFYDYFLNIFNLFKLAFYQLYVLLKMKQANADNLTIERGHDSTLINSKLSEDYHP